MELGLSQRDLARRCGLGVRTIQAIERGQVRPRHATSFLLAVALGCKPAEIRGSDDENEESAR